MTTTPRSAYNANLKRSAVWLCRSRSHQGAGTKLRLNLQEVSRRATLGNAFASGGSLSARVTFLHFAVDARHILCSLCVSSAFVRIPAAIAARTGVRQEPQ